ncbi:MAG: secretin N-terminal domain-containing protein [Candidatus Margulisiibacteriota bacterium]
MKKTVSLVLLCSILLLCQTGAFAAPAKQMENVTISKGKVYLNLRDADVKSVLQIFAKATKVNIVAADDVTGKVTVTFSGIDPKEGMEAVLRTKGLDWFEELGTIFVSTKKILRTYYLANAKPTDLQTTLTAILPAGSTVTADDAYNALVIQTTSDYLPRIERLIKELDVPPIQVMVEAKIIEIRSSNNANLGLDVKATKATNANDVIQTKNFSGRPSDNPAQGFYGQVFKAYTDVNIESYLSAMATNTNYNVIASPRITTMNNKEATILIGAKYGYKTTVISDTTTTQVVNFLSVGTSLAITPNVSKNGLIRMKVAPKVSEGSVVGDLPQENTTETKNEVVVNDGQTFVIGGLTKEKDVQTDYGVPFLMDVPVIGAFFRKTVISKEKDELLVFVTPHIVTPEYLKTMNEPKDELENKSAKQKAKLLH